jgi:hypothetical protein
MLNASNGSYQNLLIKAALRGKTAQAADERDAGPWMRRQRSPSWSTT